MRETPKPQNTERHQRNTSIVMISEELLSNSIQARHPATRVEKIKVPFNRYVNSTNFSNSQLSIHTELNGCPCVTSHPAQSGKWPVPVGASRFKRLCDMPAIEKFAARLDAPKTVTELTGCDLGGNSKQQALCRGADSRRDWWCHNAAVVRGWSFELAFKVFESRVSTC